MKKVLKHYGTPRHSGRYPWGSGEDPQRNRDFLQRVDELKKQNLSEKKIAEGLGINTSQLRARKSIAKNAQLREDQATAMRLKEKGYSNMEIGRRMNRNESSVRSLLNPTLKERADITNVTANMLKDAVAQRKFIDVGVGVEQYMGISRTKLKTALALLEEDGYKVHKFDIEQVGTGKKTNMMVLTTADVTYPEMLKNKSNVKLVNAYTENGGRSYLGLETPRSVDSKRIQIRYAEDGGSNKDGVIELRRGVEDISLGNARYAQVRIAVDGTHYLKGMAMYSDDLPKGVDILFNTNKKREDAPTTKEALKPMKRTKDTDEIDPDNPFGASVRQRHYIDSKGKDQLSALNIVNEEGEWHDKWSRSLSSQMLSKQTPALAKKQLDLAYDAKKEEHDEIMSLTNPAVKKKLLDSFADGCDSSAVHLKAAAMPRSSWHVLLPITTMKENEIYAPNYRDGETVVLIRYPHGGRFEIPEVTVNNKNKLANQTIRQAKDAVGIHHKVAERLSGADFDGDAVLVIPNNNKSIKTSAALKGLENFDPKEQYKAYEGMPKVGPKTGFHKQTQMGSVSNLITDMTIKGADLNEIARAVRHSMVVIDAEKHNLDYKRSYIDNGIGALKKKYQGGQNSGASTLISKASSEARPGVRKVHIDPLTGKKIYDYTGETYTNRQGKIIKRTTISTKMAETDDAFTLSSGTPMETIYAAHANRLKALANSARKQSLETVPLRYSPSAKKAYADEVASLHAKLNIAMRNKPLERQAQLLANAVVAAKKEANPDYEAADIKKIKGQALMEARLRVGAGKQKIEITDREWEAIQAGAITNNTLTQILSNTDEKRVKQLATPRTSLSMTPVKIKKAQAMLSAGYTQSEVAERLSVSVSTLLNAIK